MAYAGCFLTKQAGHEIDWVSLNISSEQQQKLSPISSSTFLWLILLSNRYLRPGPMNLWHACSKWRDAFTAVPILLANRRLYIVTNMNVYTYLTAYELLLLPNNTASETFFTHIRSGAKCCLDIYHWGAGLAVTGLKHDIGRNFLQYSFQTGSSNSPRYFQLFFLFEFLEEDFIRNIVFRLWTNFISIICINNNNNNNNNNTSLRYLTLLFKIPLGMRKGFFFRNLEKIWARAHKNFHQSCLTLCSISRKMMNCEKYRKRCNLVTIASVPAKIRVQTWSIIPTPICSVLTWH